MKATDVGLTSSEIAVAERLLESALAWRALPFYSPEDRMVLAILVASQKIKGRKSTSEAKRKAKHRREHVNLLLRYVIPRRFRRDEKTARSAATVMRIIEWLDDACNIEASESQVRRDINKALKLGPLPSD
jgi:hypothetical protein